MSRAGTNQMTAKEVAKILGISQATLSLVVNHKPGISDQTRKRVLEQLEENGFGWLITPVPAGGAQAVVRSTAAGAEAVLPGVLPYGGEPTDGGIAGKSIGFVTFRAGGELFDNDSFLPLILNGIEERARKYGLNLSYFTVERADLVSGLERIRMSRCAGLVIFGTEMNQGDFKSFQKLGLPIVLLDNWFQDIPATVVKVNNTQGTYLAVKHLYEQGHRRIGYLSSGADVESFRDRMEGAFRAMRSFGIEHPARDRITLAYPVSEAEEKMAAFLSGVKDRADLPTAYVGDNDQVIAGAMRAFRAAGYRIPEDVSFVGFDDRPICLMTEPALSTVRLPRRYFGGEAVELLARFLAGEDDILLEVAISTELIKRKSVAERESAT